jgi:hypothetical protein
MSLEPEEFTPDPSNGELVHWMSPGPLRVGPGGLSATAVAAFALGVATAAGAYAAFRWIAPRREGLPPWRWSRGPTH